MTTNHQRHRETDRHRDRQLTMAIPRFALHAKNSDDNCVVILTTDICRLIRLIRTVNQTVTHVLVVYARSVSTAKLLRRTFYISTTKSNPVQHNKKGQLSLTNPRDACETIARFMYAGMVDLSCTEGALLLLAPNV